MDRIDDERIRFYLKHQELIETWASVRKDAREVTHEFFLSLTDDLGERAAGLGGDLAVWRNEKIYSKVGLYRPGWDGEDEPVVQVCLEWHKQATFTTGTRFVGVRASYGNADGKSLRPYLGDTLRGIRDAAGFGRSSNHWPAYQPVLEPDGEFWNDLGDYRNGLLDTIESAWVSFSEPIQHAVAEWRASGTN
jgi:hypothetical protein